MTDSRLKPCPHCGSKDLYITREERLVYYLTNDNFPAFGLVSCNKCFASIRTTGYAGTVKPGPSPAEIAHKLYEESLEKWNTRTGETGEEVTT